MKKLLFLLIFAVVVVLGFYQSHAMLARSMVTQANLPPESVNAVKHALAARTLYRGFHFLGFETPEDQVLWLGDLNERMEKAVMIDEPDTTLEMMKDAYNNLAGITAGKWETQQGRICRDDPILILARENGLKFTPDNVPVSDAEKEKLRSGQDPDYARDWLRTQYYYLQGKMLKRLNACVKKG